MDIAIVGVTGAVGNAMLDILAERNFPVTTLYPLASERSAGDAVRFKNKSLRILDAATFDFTKVKIALFSAGASVSKELVPKVASAGCICIDNTSFFRNDNDVPLIVPEVNPECLEDYQARHIIANPNCSTIQMVVALKPIYDAVGIKRINVATYQAVSGAGRKGISELADQTAQLLNAKACKKNTFPLQIAFNAIPHIDTFQENGYTREEMKMVWETKKILQDDEIKVNPTCVRVPVFYGHSEAIHIETHEKISRENAIKLLKKAPGVNVVEKQEPAGYPSAVTHATGDDSVHVGRIREDISCDKGLNLWVVSDNVRKGGALNAVQIAELLISKFQ